MSLKEFKENNYQEFFQAVDAIPCNPTGDNGSDWYGYIAKRDMDLDVICPLIELNNPKIVDLGCGYCENLLYLGSYFNSTELHGVEMNQIYANDTHSLISEHNLQITLHESNILDHDISSYDLIYSFCPAMKNQKWAEVNSYILENMKTGAYWLEAHARSPEQENISWLQDDLPNNIEVVHSDGYVVLLRKI